MNCKRKVNPGELELLHIHEARGLQAARNDQAFVGGRENPDISLPGIHLEVKRVEALRITEALNQAVSDAAGRALPVVMHQRNCGEWVALMRLDGFRMLYSEARASVCSHYRLDDHNRRGGTMEECA